MAIHQTLASHADFTEMDKTAAAHKFCIVYPEGINKSFNAGGCCASNTEDDLGFARELVHYMQDNERVDNSKVFAMGWSNGGYMAYYLGCRAADLLSAIVVVGGLAGVDPSGSECRPAVAPRLLHFHETGDPEVNYNGGGVEFISSPDVVAVWAARQGCGTGQQQLHQGRRKVHDQHWLPSWPQRHTL
mmetsp:Transcript_119585/g.381582  ORF Transcript_119585/g.381582 Transcript_119585/m.381582 type:complete len:188 (-) Transcript_119585:284-847(-)